MTVDAQRIAEDIFWRDAPAVEATGAIPDEHFRVLADAGLYGAFAPAEMGGAGLDIAEVVEVIEVLASGCLATTFVWIQHLGLLGTLLTPGTPASLTERFLKPAVSGDLRAGIALTGLLPGPPLLQAAPVDGGWEIRGFAPWVTGWEHVQQILVAARGPDDTVVNFVLDATEAPGVTATRQRLMAADASITVRVEFDGAFVPDERVASVRDHETALAETAAGGLRFNGSLALGIANRCCRLIGPSPLDAELDEARRLLDTSDLEDMPAARATASALASRAAAALVVDRGSKAMLAGDHAERLLREAAFVLVFASRPQIKASLREQLMGSGPG